MLKFNNVDVANRNSCNKYNIITVKTSIQTHNGFCLLKGGGESLRENVSNSFFWRHRKPASKFALNRCWYITLVIHEVRRTPFVRVEIKLHNSTPSSTLRLPEGILRVFFCVCLYEPNTYIFPWFPFTKWSHSLHKSASIRTPGGTYHWVVQKS